MCAEMLKEYLKANCMGRKNTVSGASLERALHLSGNELRRYVNRLRRQGIPIASSRDGYLFRHRRKCLFCNQVASRYTLFVLLLIIVIGHCHTHYRPHRHR